MDQSFRRYLRSEQAFERNKKREKMVLRFAAETFMAEGINRDEG